MRSSVYGLAALCLLIGLQSGCDRGAVKEAAARQKLADAMGIIKEAQLGFAPEKDPSDKDPSDLQAYRQSRLKDALRKLDEAIKDGSAVQRVMARRFRAGIELSAARSTNRHATVKFARIGADSSRLLAYLRVAGRAADRPGLLDADQDRVIGELTAEKDSHTQRQGKLKQDAEALEKQLQDEQATRDTLLKKRNEAAAESAGLSEQAFVANGDARYDLYDQAADVQRAGAKTAVEAEFHLVQVDLLSSQLEVKQNQLELVSKLIADLADQAEAVRLRGQEVARQVTEADRERNEGSNQLRDEFDKVDGVFNKDVEQKLTEAGAGANRAVEDLKSAVQDAQRQDRQDVQLDLLGAYVEQVHLLDEHAAVVGRYGRLVAALGGTTEQLSLDGSAHYQDRFAKLQRRQKTLLGEAAAAADLATGLVEQFAGDETYDEFAKNQSRRLEGYAARRGQTGL